MELELLRVADSAACKVHRELQGSRFHELSPMQGQALGDSAAFESVPAPVSYSSLWK